MSSTFRWKLPLGTEYATAYRMAHPYPPHWTESSYVGRLDYALTYVTDRRERVFLDAGTVDLAWQQILRASIERRMAVIAYCFMPDHLHLIVTGEDDESDCKAFIKTAKQYSSYYYKAARGAKLWERYGHDRVLRDDVEFAMALVYLVSNPVKDGLVQHPRDYPFWSSVKYTRDELSSGAMGLRPA